MKLDKTKTSPSETHVYSTRVKYLCKSICTTITMTKATKLLMIINNLIAILMKMTMMIKMMIMVMTVMMVTMTIKVEVSRT